MDFPVPRDFDIALFFERLWMLLNDSRRRHILRWRRNQHMFVIENDQLMILEICPLMFELCTWSNFLQTLYACRFRRGREGIEFIHDLFSQRRLQALTREERHELFRMELGYKPSMLTDSNLYETWAEWLGPEIHIRRITNAAGNVQVVIVTPVDGDGSTSNTEVVPRPRVRKNLDPRRYEGEDEIIDVERISSDESNDDLSRTVPPTHPDTPSGSSTLITGPHPTSDDESTRNDDQTNDSNTALAQQRATNNEAREQDSADNNEESSGDGSTSNNGEEESSENISDQEASNHNEEDQGGNNSNEESSNQESNNEGDYAEASDNNTDESSTNQDSNDRDQEDNSANNEEGSTNEESNDDQDESSANNGEEGTTNPESSNNEESNDDQDEGSANNGEEGSTNPESNNEDQAEGSGNEESGNQESNNEGNDNNDGEESSSDSSSDSDDAANDNEETPVVVVEKTRRSRKPATPTKFRRGNHPNDFGPSTSTANINPNLDSSNNSEQKEQSDETNRERLILRIPKRFVKEYEEKKQRGEESSVDEDNSSASDV